MTHSIRFKFILFILAILLVLILLLNLYPVTSSRETMIQEKRSSLTSQASAVSSALARLEPLAPEDVSRIIGALDLDNFDRITVIGTDGRTIFDDGEGSFDSEDLRTALRGEIAFQSALTGTDFISSIAVPIVSPDGLRGAAALYENDLDLARLLLTVRERIAVLSLMIGALVLLLAITFSWAVLRRLNDLTRSMGVVAGGDYSYRHIITGSDEISELGREFNALTEQLETNEVQRRRFVSDASHELKTPLASIRLLSDSILQTENMDPDTVREFVSDIRTESDRLQRTTEKLLVLSRMDDDIKVVPEPVDLKQVTLDTLSSLAPLARDRRVSLGSQLDDGCVVMASREDMERIIFNLAENAIKYNVPNGSVTVRLSQDDNSVHLSVEDTGIGIPEEDRLNIFTRFYRVDKARSRQSGGSGLGLSIVHDAVTAYGGSIRVGNNRPQGSVFIVSFPRPTSEETGI